MPRTESHPRFYLLIGALWIAGALAFAGSGMLAALAPPRPQLVFGATTLVLLLLGAFAPGFRLWIAGLNLRQIVAFHVTRFVGIWFLLLASSGRLPASWAVPAGWGDIVIAAAAVGIVLFVPDLIAHRATLLAWNVLGLADLLYVVGTAARQAIAEPPSMAYAVRLPFAAIPMILVPLLIASHVLLFFRLKREPVSAAG